MAALGADGASSLGACVLPPPAAAAAGVGAAACAALAALFDGCGAAAAPLLASILPTLQRCFPSPLLPSADLRHAVAVVRAAVVGVAGRCGADSDADAQLAALVAHVGGALATGGRSDDAAAHAAQQALWAEWFELYAEVAAARRTTEAREETRSMAAAPPHQKYAATNGGGGEADGGVVDAVTAVVVGAMPSLLGCVWAALRSPPPPDLYDDADGVIGLKTALVMLAQLKPTHATPAGATVRGPLGDALRGALDAPAAAAAAGGGGEARAGWCCASCSWGCRRGCRRGSSARRRRRAGSSTATTAPTLRAGCARRWRPTACRAAGSAPTRRLRSASSSSARRTGRRSRRRSST